MKKMKLIFTIILLFSLCGCELSFSSTTTNKQDRGKSILSIIEMNDVHGFIEQNSSNKLGLSNMAYLINEVREEQDYDNVLLLGNGDMFQGTALSKMSYGRVLIDCMNVMDFDACTIGNHEFDWGLDVILDYFDGNIENGEANFPLLNANVYYNNSLLTIDNGNIFESYTYDKANVKVGVIGYIGDVKSSINKVYVEGYDFDLEIAESVKKIGSKLKSEGADIIVVAIHDGATNEYYSVNRELSALRYNGKFLVDAIINGHTHTKQAYVIARPDNPGLPVIQSNGYQNNYLYTAGRIDLTIDLEEKKVSKVGLSHIQVSSAGANYDQGVEAIIDSYYNMSKDELEEEYCYNEISSSKNSTELRKWVSNVMLAATGADIAICNTGGLRTNLPEGILTIAELYAINPFDNVIVIHECDASLINEFIDSSYYFYSVKGSLKTSGTYKVAVIDYVFNSDYYNKCRTSSYVNSKIILRDALISDLRLRESINVYDNNEAVLSQIYNG